MLSNLQQRIIKLTFGRLTHPEVRQSFETKLAAVLHPPPLEIMARLIQHLNEPPVLRQMIEDYLHRYPDYITALPLIRDALCESIKQHVPEIETPAILSAWEAFYTMLIEMIPAGARTV